MMTMLRMSSRRIEKTLCEPHAKKLKIVRVTCVIVFADPNSQKGVVSKVQEKTPILPHPGGPEAFGEGWQPHLGVPILRLDAVRWNPIAAPTDDDVVER
jgi:hypothetical protein